MLLQLLLQLLLFLFLLQVLLNVWELLAGTMRRQVGDVVGGEFPGERGAKRCLGGVLRGRRGSWRGKSTVGAETQESVKLLVNQLTSLWEEEMMVVMAVMMAKVMVKMISIMMVVMVAEVMVALSVAVVVVVVVVMMVALVMAGNKSLQVQQQQHHHRLTKINQKN